MTDTTTNEGTPATTTAATTEGAAATTQAAATDTAQSLLSEQAATGAAATDVDWLPEKFRVTGEDGKLDEAASSRKLAESYKALEAHKGPTPPASPDDYKLEPPEGVEAEAFTQFTADPLFAAFAKDAHAQGMTNDQLQFVTSKYLELAPQLMQADKQLTADEARSELGKVWTSEQAMKQNLGNVVRAINGFGAEADDVPGSRSRLMEKYGTDPDFIAFAAAVAADMKEDQLPAGGQAPSADADIDSLQKSEAYWNPAHADHEKTKAKVAEHYARKFGTQPRRGAVAR